MGEITIDLRGKMKNKIDKFKSGAVRENNEGKGKYVLLAPRAIKRVALRAEYGSKKYSSRNWEKGMPNSRFLDSALRHLFQYMEGKNSEDHLAASCWNIMAIMEQEEKIKEGKLSKEFDDVK